MWPGSPHASASDPELTFTNRALFDSKLQAFHVRLGTDGQAPAGAHHADDGGSRRLADTRIATFAGDIPAWSLITALPHASPPEQCYLAM
jgi:hypothetical protein